LRFNSASSDYLNRTPASAGNRTTWTWSGWVKRSILGSVKILFSAGTSGTNDTTLYFGNSDDKLIFFNRISSSVLGYLETNQLFRDVSAWYHIVAVWNSNNATAGDRMRLYVNGSEITSFASDTNPSLNENSFINNNVAHYIGNDSSLSSINYYGGYLSEVNFIDGQALTPSSFGASNSSGVWYPIPYQGTYGTNGFYLKFANSASLGTDSSGNTNTFTVNGGIASTSQSTDTELNNFATWNPLYPLLPAGGLSNGNLTAKTNGADSIWRAVISNIGASTGKWYAEIKWVAGSYFQYGFISSKLASARQNFDLTEVYNYQYVISGTNLFSNGSLTSSFAPATATGDIIMLALDMTNAKLYWGKNGTWINSANPALGTNGISIGGDTTEYWNFACCIYSSSGTGDVTANFGNPPYSANGYTDGAGYGNFSYAVPSGYYALCTKNLNTYG
jgi:hypothetical protein